jgi:hypothetical protein
MHWLIFELITQNQTVASPYKLAFYKKNAIFPVFCFFCVSYIQKIIHLPLNKQQKYAIGF